MARILSRSLLRDSKTLIRDPHPFSILKSSPRSRLVAVRLRSGKSSPAAAAQVEVVEVDAGEVSGGGGGEVELRVGMRKLEEAIHGIIVRRAAPGWLPFVPGSSYWVPPRGASLGLVELVGKLANPMTEDEAMSFTTAQGWPSRAYFLEGSSPHPVNKTRTRKVVQSDDEE